MITIKPYTSDFKIIWDSFVKKSKNGTFLFQRDYIEYHKDRFTDFSLLFFKEEKLIALLPGNIQNQVLYSHQGLTYGGFVVDDKMKQIRMLHCFQALLSYLKKREIQQFFYTPVPTIYHKKAAQEDLFALHKLGFTLFRRNISTTIMREGRCKLSKGRKAVINKARRMGIELRQTDNFKDFMTILEQSLARKHNSKPIHSLPEIHLLASLFPNQIKLFIAELEGEVIAGTIIYETTRVAHAQYIAASEAGEEIGATDLLLDHLIKEQYQDKPVFDFGTSMKDNDINEGLLFYKESLGGRVTTNDYYSINNL